MTSLVEKVEWAELVEIGAQDIWDRFPSPERGAWKDASAEAKQDCRDIVHAALVAVTQRVAFMPHEPTEEMLVSAGATPESVMPIGGVDRLRNLLPRYYAAMRSSGEIKPNPG